MRLAQLLASLSEAELAKIALEHLRTDQQLSHVQLCNHLESVIRSARFLGDFIVNRQPPTFSLLSVLLDTQGLSVAREELRSRAEQETARIREQLDAGELLVRDDGLRIYRKLLYEARRSDADINTSEASLLAVYRREHGIPLSSHFLIEHHTDLREFWMRDEAFDHALGALIASGVLFERDGNVILPEDLVSGVLQALGLSMDTGGTRRLLEHVSSGDMADVLETQMIKSSGSRAEREERLLHERVPANLILEGVGIGELRDICRNTNLSGSGVKDELIERLIAHFAAGHDVVVEAPPPEPLREPRRLNEARFRLLFGCLKNQELLDILRRREGLRQTGSKDQRVTSLWEAHVSETNLLNELMNRDLEDVLQRVGLRLSGSKPERVERLIGHFAGQSVGLEDSCPVELVASPVNSPAVVEHQEAFRKNASSSQQTLQDWLEHLLESPGLVRCYGTEVANPTQQLKNKLSQAAAAKNGLLVLTLADSDALAKTEAALAERWMSNDEWSKSVACVALAQPPGSATVEVLIERASSSPGSRLLERVFPQARVISVAPPVVTCSKCRTELPNAARFCPTCGTPVAVSPGPSGAHVSVGT